MSPSTGVQARQCPALTVSPVHVSSPRLQSTSPAHVPSPPTGRRSRSARRAGEPLRRPRNSRAEVNGFSRGRECFPSLPGPTQWAAEDRRSVASANPCPAEVDECRGGGGRAAATLVRGISPDRRPRTPDHAVPLHQMRYPVMVSTSWVVAHKGLSPGGTRVTLLED